MNADNKIFSMLFQEEELSWQSMIYRLIEEEQMNPWDINVSLLAKKFLSKLKKLKSLNFRLSGKIILASALLLRIKSKHLLDVEIAQLDQLLSQEDPIEELEEIAQSIPEISKGNILPRTPQPRERKISVYDLVKALEKALKQEQKKHLNKKNIKHEITIPKKPEKDIRTRMKELLTEMKDFFNKQPKILFNDLAPSESREDKINTFVPLLHLENQRALDLIQEEHFGDIEIKLLF